MHPIQKKLAELSQTHDFSRMSFRQIGQLVGIEHPQKVKHHLSKLKLLNDKSHPSPVKKGIISLPILGLANCGDATMIAETNIDGYLSVSRKLLNEKNPEDMFVVKAVGSSMNTANIDGKTISDGDYVVVDPNNQDIRDGNYVLSVIGGLANIKKYSTDPINHQIILRSESTKYFPPIYIHEDDMQNYVLNGKVVQVIKESSDDEIRYVPLNQ